ncbi:hypothetical protein SUGI_0846730 [Cryptomeria japonica]|nr:hypothetical protein SUGI_0846730 [Cryptomeria japonica]
MENHNNALYLPSVEDLSALNRHVYIEIGGNDTESSVSGLFVRVYAKQIRAFDIYAVGVDDTALASISIVNLDGLKAVRLMQSEILGWMKRNISEKDFVVAKLGFPK